MLQKSILGRKVHKVDTRRVNRMVKHTCRSACFVGACEGRVGKWGVADRGGADLDGADHAVDRVVGRVVDRVVDRGAGLACVDSVGRGVAVVRSDRV